MCAPCWLRCCCCCRRAADRKTYRQHRVHGGVAALASPRAIAALANAMPNRNVAAPSLCSLCRLCCCCCFTAAQRLPRRRALCPWPALRLRPPASNRNASSSSSHQFGAGTRGTPPGYPAAARSPAAPGRIPLRRTTPPESPLVSGPEAAECRSRGVPNRRGSPSPLVDLHGLYCIL